MNYVTVNARLHLSHIAGVRLIHTCLSLVTHVSCSICITAGTITSALMLLE